MSPGLSLVAPGWKSKLARDDSLARSCFASGASRLIAGGPVFGISISMMRGMPPAMQARDSVSLVLSCTSPGSRKWIWPSIMPGNCQLPAASKIRSLACAGICASMRSMRPLRTHTSASKRRPSLKTCALAISQSFMGFSRVGPLAKEGPPAEFGGHRIDATFAQWLAAQQPVHRQPAAACAAKTGNRNARIVRAAGVKTAACTQHGTDEAFVKCQQ